MRKCRALRCIFDFLGGVLEKKRLMESDFALGVADLCFFVQRHRFKSYPVNDIRGFIRNKPYLFEL